MHQVYNFNDNGLIIDEISLLLRGDRWQFFRAIKLVGVSHEYRKFRRIEKILNNRTLWFPFPQFIEPDARIGICPTGTAYNLRTTTFIFECSRGSMITRQHPDFQTYVHILAGGVDVLLQ